MIANANVSTTTHSPLPTPHSPLPTPHSQLPTLNTTDAQWARDHHPNPASASAPLVIRYDSKYAANMVNGSWHAKVNVDLVDRGRTVYYEMIHHGQSGGRKIVFDHVKVGVARVG